jgi:DNA-binding transcriptional MerR regulator
MRTPPSMPLPSGLESGRGRRIGSPPLPSPDSPQCGVLGARIAVMRKRQKILVGAADVLVVLALAAVALPSWSARTLQRWHASKLLVPSQERTIGTKKHWQYRRQDVLTFAERYIPVREASALLGCTSLTLQSWTRGGILPAVSGPHIDGAYRYRFDKAVLMQWRHRLGESGRAPDRRVLGTVMVCIPIRSLTESSPWT